MKHAGNAFKTMAATGKLVRITELDLSLGTSSPSSNQYKAQSDAYRMIVESYKANVPEAQQSGITIWSLSDNEAEHEYWLKGQVPTSSTRTTSASGLTRASAMVSPAKTSV